jgi:predicted transcriptional regulator
VKKKVIYRKMINGKFKYWTIVNGKEKTIPEDLGKRFNNLRMCKLISI